MSKVLCMIVCLVLLGCSGTATRAFKHAERENPGCSIKEVTRTRETVTTDAYCGTGYPVRRTYKANPRVE
jgi:hypothetical protein